MPYAMKTRARGPAPGPRLCSYKATESRCVLSKYSFFLLVIQPYSHIAIQPHSHIAKQPNSLIVIQPNSLIAMQPYSQTALNPYSHIALQPYSHIAIAIQHTHKNVRTFGPRNRQNESNMVGDWYQKWSTKVKKLIFPEMTQKGLETVRIASGSPGNLFLY